MRRYLLVFIPIFFCGQVTAQTLCGVAGVSRNINSPSEFNFVFNGKADMRILPSLNRGEANYDMKAGKLTSSGKPLSAINATLGESFYVTQEADHSCVVRFEERNEVVGIYIEEHISPKGKPPQLRTEFIELR